MSSSAAGRQFGGAASYWLGSLASLRAKPLCKFGCDEKRYASPVSVRHRRGLRTLVTGVGGFLLGVNGGRGSALSW